MTRTPKFTVLPAREARAVLRRNHVGRMAFTHGREVDIEPLGYVAKGDWLFMRSAPGTKLDALAHRPYVAFEVDEVDGPFDWRSVVVHGTIYRLPIDGSPRERLLRRNAIAAFRRIAAGAFSANDPVPERRFVYGLYVDRAEGRSARAVTSRRVKS